MALEFSAESEKRIQDVIDEYYNREAALIPVFYIAIDQFGYLTPEVFDLISQRMELSRMQVESVATFYTMLHRQPVGKYHVQVCRTLSCAMAGAPNLISHIEKKLGIKPGEVTEDGKFSLEAAECLAMCGTAPAMIINKTNYEQLTVEKVDQILDSLK